VLLYTDRSQMSVAEREKGGDLLQIGRFTTQEIPMTAPANF